jgi:hypothetical protein
MKDEWMVEVYYRNLDQDPDFTRARSADEAVSLAAQALAWDVVGGLVIYRPPVAESNEQESGEMLLSRGEATSTAAVQDPVAWLQRHDHDLELHQTVKTLLDGHRPSEAVLILEQYIGATAPVRARVVGWGNEWDKAVRDLSQCRSIRQVRTVQHLLRTVKTERLP